MEFPKLVRNFIGKGELALPPIRSTHEALGHLCACLENFSAEMLDTRSMKRAEGMLFALVRFGGMAQHIAEELHFCRPAPPGPGA